MNLHANAALSLKGRRARKWVGRYRAEGELGGRGETLELGEQVGQALADVALLGAAHAHSAAYSVSSGGGTSGIVI